jgi:hypothetical protein
MHFKAWLPFFPLLVWIVAGIWLGEEGRDFVLLMAGSGGILQMNWSSWMLDFFSPLHLSHQKTELGQGLLCLLTHLIHQLFLVIELFHCRSKHLNGRIEAINLFLGQMGIQIRWLPLIGWWFVLGWHICWHICRWFCAVDLSVSGDNSNSNLVKSLALTQHSPSQQMSTL